jgi:replicative DNA helicase
VARDTIHEPSVIGNLLAFANKALTEEVAFSADLQEQDFQDPKCQLAYRTILDCWKRDIVISPAILHTESKKHLPMDWLQKITKEDQVGWEEVVSRARLVVAQAEERATTRVLLQGLTMMEEGKPIIQVKDRLIDQLATNRGREILDSSVRSIRKRIDKHREDGSKIFVTETHIDWLDKWLGDGLRSNRFLAIAARQGGRKSTWARSMILGALRDKYRRPRQDVSVAWLGFENDQNITYYDFVSMCAMEWLHENNALNAQFEHNGTSYPIKGWLGAESIERLYHKGLDNINIPTLRQAIEVGMERVEQLNLGIYDSGEQTGNLWSRTDMHTCIRAHHFKHVSELQHYIIVVDYAQLVRETSKLFEDMEALARESLRVAQKFNATFILLTQFNEEFNKDKAKGEAAEGYAGIKGGGDIKAAVHNLMVLEYSQDANMLKVKAAKARRGKSFGEKIYEVEPISGIILSDHNRSTNS